MFDSVTQGMNALQIDPAKKKEIRQYADLAVFRFRAVMKQGEESEKEPLYDSSDSLDLTPDVQDEISQDQADSVASTSNQKNLSQVHSPSDQEGYHLFRGELKPKRDAVDQLKSTFFPRLKHLITKIHLYSDPARLLKDPALYLQHMLDMQPKLAHTLDQISRARHIISPSSDKMIHLSMIQLPKNDQQYRDLKSFRIVRFELFLDWGFWSETFELIQACCASIERLGLSRVYSPARYRNIPTTWTPGDSSMVLMTINTAIECFTQSEFNLVLSGWSYRIHDINDTLSNCLSLIHPTSPARENEPAIQIARSIVPIMKLSRLFLIKFLRYCKKRLPHFTGMRSDQLLSLQKLPREVADCFENFKDLMTASVENRGHLRRDFGDKARSLKAHFDSASLIISFHVVPLISDADTGHNSFQTWLMSWCDQFGLANENLMSIISR